METQNTVTKPEEKTETAGKKMLFFFSEKLNLIVLNLQRKIPVTNGNIGSLVGEIAGENTKLEARKFGTLHTVKNEIFELYTLNDDDMLLCSKNSENEYLPFQIGEVNEKETFFLLFSAMTALEGIYETVDFKNFQ